MNQGSYNLGGEEVKEESSWRYPLIIFVTTIILCVIFLYHYVGPDVEELQGNKPRPTISDEIVQLAIGETTFNVPANYTVFPRARRPGDRDSVILYASWPRMEGYVPARRSDFVENAFNSRRIDITIRKKGTPFTEEQRLEILYFPNVNEREGAPYDFGLTRYSFKKGGALESAPASGYANKELLIARDESGDVAALFCYQGKKDDVVPPECYREFDFNDRVSVKYRFKRAYLAEWQRIDSRVHEFVSGLAQ